MTLSLIPEPKCDLQGRRKVEEDDKRIRKRLTIWNFAQCQRVNLALSSLSTSLKLTMDPELQTSVNLPVVLINRRGLYVIIAVLGVSIPGLRRRADVLVQQLRQAEAECRGGAQLHRLQGQGR
ncbi:hypothetical protein MTO96_026202 [Rhipicephalus appendiculatus]